MNKKWLIYSYENSYSGLHGIYDIQFFEGTEKEANEIGREASVELIDSYSFIAEEFLGEDYTNEEYEDFLEEEVAWEIYELPDDVDLNKLDEENLGIEGYIGKYINKEEGWN